MTDNLLTKVFIVDESKHSREILLHIINAEPNLEVLGVADGVVELFYWLKRLTPDVILIDLKISSHNAFEVVRRIMESRPIPVIILSAESSFSNTEIAFKALEAGALALLQKPEKSNNPNFTANSKELITTIKNVAGVKLLSRRFQSKTYQSSVSNELKANKVLPSSIKAVAIGASLGGPPAIADILSRLTTKFPLPIYIVQHIATGFIEGFLKWLQERCALPISLAVNGEIAHGSHVYVAPDKCQMEIKKGNVIILENGKRGLQPSVASLFRSMANTYGPHCMGILLTGMGSDGAQELLLMKEKGAYTIAQDKESCVVFGMPGKACALGAVDLILPPIKIAEMLNDLCEG